MWTLKLTLHPYEVQRRIDSEPWLDDASRIIAHLIEWWHMLPEDMTEMADWSEEYVEVRDIESLDLLIDPMWWIMSNIVPLKVELISDEAVA